MVKFYDDIFKIIGKEIPNKIDNINNKSVFDINTFNFEKINYDKTKGLANDIYKRIHVDNTKKYLPDEMIKWKEFEDYDKLLRGESSLLRGETNALIRSSLPYYKYKKLIKQSDVMAKKYGFKNELELAKEIEYGAYLCKTPYGRNIVNNNPRFINLYHQLKRIKNKSTMIKAALIGGTVSGLIIYLGKVQNEKSGCFRYNLDEKQNLVKYKVGGGNFCIGSGEGEDDLKDVNIIVLPEEEHPLFNKDKWDCDFDKFNATTNIDREYVQKIVQLGCNGLCNLKNFNMLANFTSGDNLYNKVTAEEKFKKYMFVCERPTFLRTLIDETGGVVGQVASEIFGSDVFKEIIQKISYYIPYILFILIVILFLYNLKGNMWRVIWKNNENFIPYYPRQ